MIFLFLRKNIDCGYMLEPPRRGGSNEHPQSMFSEIRMKNTSVLSEIFQFLEVKFSIYLNKYVFVMESAFARGVNGLLLLGFYHSLGNVRREQIDDILSYFSQKIGLGINIKAYFR